MEDKKLFLMQYRVCEKEIERLQEEIMRLKSKAERMTTALSIAPSGGCGEGFPASVEHIAELQARLCAELEHSLAVHDAITRTIAAVPNTRARLLLSLRYIDGLTWERIAEKMGITERWARVIHEKKIKTLRITSL